MPDPVGRNNGSVQGVQYFRCAANVNSGLSLDLCFGLFVRRSQIVSVGPVVAAVPEAQPTEQQPEEQTSGGSGSGSGSGGGAAPIKVPEVTPVPQRRPPPSRPAPVLQLPAKLGENNTSSGGGGAAAAAAGGRSEGGAAGASAADLVYASQPESPEGSDAVGQLYEVGTASAPHSSPSTDVLTSFTPTSVTCTCSNCCHWNSMLRVARRPAFSRTSLRS